MITTGSAHRLQRLHRLQVLTIPRQRGSLIVSGKPKTLMRGVILPPAGTDPINCDIALGQKIDNVLVGWRKAQVPTHRAQDDFPRKPVMFEGRLARYGEPQKPKSGKAR